MAPTANIKAPSKSNSAEGGAVGGGPEPKTLTPVLPPLFPPAPPPAPLRLGNEKKAKIYSRLKEYLRNNCSLPSEPKPSGFMLERYTDQYKSPEALQPHLLYNLPVTCIPGELSSRKPGAKMAPPLVRPPVPLWKVKTEPVSDDEGEPVVKKNREEDDDEEEKQENAGEDGDFEDEVDEELDDGTDYAQSYFDNGEGDDDDRDEDDGPTY